MITLLLFGMSTLSVSALCRTHSPRSAMAQVKSFLTRIFFDLRSRWAIAGFPKIRIEFSLWFKRMQAPNWTFLITKWYSLLSFIKVNYTLCADDRHMKMGKSSRNRKRHIDQLFRGNNILWYVVKQGAVRVVFCYQP